MLIPMCIALGKLCMKGGVWDIQTRLKIRSC